jgi:hypothetical protein
MRSPTRATPWRYVPEELQARAAGRGIWGTNFENPEDWRHSH